MLRGYTEKEERNREWLLAVKDFHVVLFVGCGSDILYFLFGLDNLILYFSFHIHIFENIWHL
jgi:hypothetical protein